MVEGIDNDGDELIIQKQKRQTLRRICPNFEYIVLRTKLLFVYDQNIKLIVYRKQRIVVCKHDRFFVLPS